MKTWNGTGHHRLDRGEPIRTNPRNEHAARTNGSAGSVLQRRVLGKEALRVMRKRVERRRQRYERNVQLAKRELEDAQRVLDDCVRELDELDRLESEQRD